MKEELDQIRKHATLFAAVVDVFAASLPQPSMYTGASYAGFRYLNPTAKHFCLIKAVRSVSGINAAVVLAASQLFVKKKFTEKSVVVCWRS